MPLSPFGDLHYSCTPRTTLRSWKRNYDRARALTAKKRQLRDMLRHWLRVYRTHFVTLRWKNTARKM